MCGLSFDVEVVIRFGGMICVWFVGSVVMLVFIWLWSVWLVGLRLELFEVVVL